MADLSPSPALVTADYTTRLFPAHPRGSEDPGLRPVHSLQGMSGAQQISGYRSRHPGLVFSISSICQALCQTFICRSRRKALRDSKASHQTGHFKPERLANPGIRAFAMLNDPSLETAGGPNADGPVREPDTP